ncbi:amino acid permease [Spirochaetia bacterium]|nr:amino acid permease [Spirochaetia bacterium]
MARESAFNKVLNKGEVFALAFGAMIGWGWVVLAGDWIGQGGSAGAMIAFAMGGLMVLFVGLTYAELTPAMPKCGGEFVFSMRALGKFPSFICTWAIILGYVGVVAFEACALPTVIQYIIPAFGKGPVLYTVAGFDIRIQWLIVAILVALLITVINYIGIKSAAIFNSVLTVVIAVAGILLVVSSVFSGEASNMQPLFEDGFPGILSVAVMTPFMFVGFDVLPQASEEMNIPPKNIGFIMMLSILMAVIWYIVIIFAVSFVMSKTDLVAAETSLTTAEAMSKAFHWEHAGKILVIGGMAGILTSWNAFFVGGSRAIYAMGEANMVPRLFARLHPKFKTPGPAIILIGIISCIAPFFGRRMMVWLTDAGSAGVVVAYLLVSLSFLILRVKEPNMERPYKIKNGPVIGVLAVVLSLAMGILYIPGVSPSALTPVEGIIFLSWVVLGVIFGIVAKLVYKDKFGQSENLIYPMGSVDRKNQEARAH